MVQIIYHAMAGFTGGLVFMYIQCKVYLQLCRKWKAYNRTIVVQVLPVKYASNADNCRLKSKYVRPLD